VNDGSGMVLPRVGVLNARQRFRVVECDPDKHDTTEGLLRVTTLAYDYEMKDDTNSWLWRMHWHPTGNSAATHPHVHLPTMAGHLATPRMLIEHAVKWAHEFGATMRRDDWENVLALSEANHVLYRSWSSIPPPE